MRFTGSAISQLTITGIERASDLMQNLEFKDEELRKIGLIESKRRIVKDTYFRES